MSDTIEIHLRSQQGDVSTFHVPAGTPNSLLELFEDSGVKSPFGCRVGTCGTCVVRVISGGELLEAPKQMEADTLERVTEKGSTLRLACRAIVKAGASGLLVIEKVVIR
ncbi:MAG: 2Fe-2S iron-sulfur cluster-binding protein [Bdellovibrionota bacterium]